MSPRTQSQPVVIALLAAVLATVGAHAAVIHVPGGAPTIQIGIDIASLGDTVLVAPGTYTGAGNRDIDFDGGSVILRGELGAASTIIDCQGLGRGFYFHSGEDTTAVVEGFTIENAVADTGAAVLCTGGASPRFEDCVFQQNTAADIGGGVACLGGSQPIFRDCTFGANEATGGSSPRGGAAACMEGSNALFRGCSISGNTAASFGGGVYCNSSSPSFRSCMFTFNEATSQGGGAMFIVAISSPMVESCGFLGNTCGTDGGAIYVQSSPVNVSDCLFYLNEAGSMAGAVSLLYPQSTGQFTDCTFVGNYAQIGGALYLFNDANVNFGNCTFLSNSASVDAALMAVNSAAPVLTRSIIASSEGAALTYCGGTADPVFFRCVLFGNAVSDDLCGSVSDTLHRDPLFCDVLGFDWSLCEDSVCAPANNAWSELIGSKPVGCGACGTPVEPTTWGSIKALFR